MNAKSAAGETLSASKVDSVNTFDAPNTVVPKPFSAKAQDGKLTLKLEPKSVTAIDRKSTRLNSSHSQISYAVFCLKKKIIEAGTERRQIYCRTPSVSNARALRYGHV